MNLTLRREKPQADYLLSLASITHTHRHLHSLTIGLTPPEASGTLYSMRLSYRDAEYRVVNSHKQAILAPRLRPSKHHGARDRCYKDMPFYDGWNPAKGGSVKAGAEWIILNLGRRPGPDWQIHIIDRLVGFVPGNLAWIPRDSHKQQELCAQLLRENQVLRARVAEFENPVPPPIQV